jgi:hypothetical protein
LERFRSVVENNQFPRVGKVTVSIDGTLVSSDEMLRLTILPDELKKYEGPHLPS